MRPFSKCPVCGGELVEKDVEKLFMEPGMLLPSVANYNLIAEGVRDTISENQSAGRDLKGFENAE